MRPGAWVLGTSIAIAVFSWWPDIVERWRASSPPPIEIPDATARWINDRQFDIVAPGFVWSDTCQTVWVSWWVQTRSGTFHPITTHAVHGPFAKRGELPSRYKISITPKEGPPLKLRATLPEGVSKSDVVLVAVDDTVPDNEPCDSGWTGVMQVFRLEIQPMNNGGGS